MTGHDDSGDDGDARALLSRRALLAGSLTVGTVGALSGGASVLLLTDRNVARENEIAGPRMDLRLAWREYHDGEAVETPGHCGGGFDDYAVDGAPVVELEEVEPGDEGALTVCARTAKAGRDVWARLVSGPSMEHGQRPLEREHGDDTPTEGELDEHLEITAYRRDECGVGYAGSDPYAGSLADVADGPLGSGVELGESPNTCLTVEWRLPDDSVPPTVLTDSVRFSVEFAAVQSRGADGPRNPWGGVS